METEKIHLDMEQGMTAKTQKTQEIIHKTLIGKEINNGTWWFLVIKEFIINYNK